MVKRKAHSGLSEPVEEIGAIDGCPILRVLCEGWDSQISPFHIPQQHT